MDPEQFCKQLPKIELHAHLNGSLSADSLQKLGCTSYNVAEYQKLTKLTKGTLDDCFTLFKIAHNATTNRQSVYSATKYVIEEFYEENVIYLKLRTTPRSEKGMSKADYIESVVEAIKECPKGILVKLLLSIDRAHDAETSKEAMKLIIQMKEKYPTVIKGVDFSGNPCRGSFNSNLFKTARDNGLFVTLHCGEIKKAEEIKNILDFNPNRIGHATALHPNCGGTEENWKQYLTLKTPLEACLTSNVACGTAKSYKDHHLRHWIHNSLPFTLCTDDKGVFATTLSKELALAMQHFGLSQNELWDINYRSIDYTFASDQEKYFIRRLLNDWKVTNRF